MEGKIKLLFGLIAVTLATCVLFYKSSAASQNWMLSISKPVSQLFGQAPADNAMAQLMAIQKARVKQLKDHCKARADHFYSQNITENLQSLIVDNVHHLIFCYVPKNGCSFWKRVFSILDGGHKGKEVFNLSSVDIHRDTDYGKLSTDIAFAKNYHSLKTSRKIMFTRDPYERLFSGYIDKFFAPCAMVNLARQIIVNFRHPLKKRDCEVAVSVSFAEFLEYVVNTKGLKVDNHFTKQYTQCHPCHIDYHYIGKFETFHDDVDFILKSIKVDPSEVYGPEEKFDENSDVNILQDVAKRSFDKCSSAANRCLSHYDMLQRVWVLYQVRGLLSIDIPFSLSREQAGKITLEEFVNLAVSANGRARNRTVVKRQRQQALLEAYLSVPRNLLVKVERYVSEDCALFGYSCSAELRFNQSLKPDKPLFRLNEILFSIK